MNCPVCNKNNAAALSVCPGCGTMVSDSVRAEVINRVSSIAKPPDSEANLNCVISDRANISAKIANQYGADAGKPGTSSISTKLTSPTLVEFHTASAIVPEWRLQLQNTVRQRHERAQNNAGITTSAASRQPNLVTNGATALKIETLEAVAEPEAARVAGNPKLASALQRIENSRQKFLAAEEEEETAPAPAPEPTKANKNYPFYIASKTNEADVIKAPVDSTVKAPQLTATTFRAVTKELDTNKLPALPSAENISTGFVNNPAATILEKLEIAEIKGEEIKVEEKKTVEAANPKTGEAARPEEVECEEDDDCAPFAMRFNAGLFDLIIGSFLSLILLAPFILMTEGWLSTAGIFAFLATCAVVMFTYLTTTISMHGKTFGMRLFSLELIDVEGENYPTLHQAAVSSAVYLLSLAFGGIGFITLPFNEEKRAVHDLVSGTVVVKEY